MKKGEYKYSIGDKIGDAIVEGRNDDSITVKCSCGRSLNLGRKNMYKYNGVCNCPKHLKVIPKSVWGKITVLSHAHGVGSKSFWNCRCECGIEKVISSNALITGRTVSCGCGRRSIQKDREDLIINDYASGIKIDDLCVKYKTGPQQIRDMMNRRGKKRRSPAETVIKYKMDETVFESLTRDSMYWLGMLGSDGNLKDDRVTLGLQSSDINHLQKFKNFCKSEQTIKMRKNGAFSVFRFTSKRVAKSLIKFGIVPKKSLIYEPYWYCKNNSDFWRGMIDGDGSILLNDKGRFRVVLYGSKDAVFSFSEWVKKHCDTNANPKKVLNIYSFAVSGEYAKKICEVLYANNPKYYLDRKARVAEKVLGIKLPDYAV